MIRTAALCVYYAVAILILGPPGILYTLIVGSVEWLYWRAMAVAHFGLRLVGIRIEVLGRDDFDHAGTYIFLFNHVSNIDPPLVIPLIPRRTSVLLKKELMRIPILSRAMKMASFVPVDRSNRDAAIASVEKAVEVLKQGVNISIFPEGTRSRDGNLLPFKKGPFHLAMESGVDVVPVSLVGTRPIWPKGRMAISGGTAKVIFHPPMSPKNFATREELAEAVRAQIERGLQTSAATAE
jgi:1-acyl-sn-glycerol-3-phosphate acyltransferase